jgi:predicted nucleic acid-binding protein
MNLVIDASVVVKWLVSDPGSEPDVDRALELLQGIHRGDVTPLQPPHWLAEVAAVLTRLAPAQAEQALALLDAMELPMADGLPLYQRASRLAHQLNHHLFDTLYHAVALEHGCLLVSADTHYLRKAHALGSVVALADWRETLPGGA